MFKHPEIEAILIGVGADLFKPNSVMLQNAELLLNYIDDINLERPGKFELTAADSLYLLWNAEGLEFHLECLKNGRIFYTFRKGGYGNATGSATIDEFIPMLESYLLIGIS
ncbi:hypothetical protein [Mucilaginibacter xinganensis]|uniref:Uncharacterized protein n=1 Tax=Mucilaginibacter xinganensis TaxID=1234841 RepID=A0A223P0E4_9SPHI|nr:hypothetical protein [Mucilaginibacter xinganensis]ASU35556.1 hypothetical protein MuYL_3671 [Mucilaginibacter xinganensis]